MREDFQLEQIDTYLKNNAVNTVKYLNRAGKIVEKRFDELHQDALKVMNYMMDIGIQHGDSMMLVGKSSYYWLVTEVACIYLGVESIAIPENFSQIQIVEFMNRYKANGLAIDPDINNENTLISSTYENVIILDDKMFTEHKMLCNKVDREKAGFKIKVFTSGTTSKIKSFSINKCSTEKMMERLVEYFKIECNDSWLICHPFSHYSHLEYALGGLCFGYNIILVDVTTTLLRIKELKPSILISVPETYYFFYNKLQRILAGEEDKKKREKMIKEYFGGRVKAFLIGAAPSRKEVKKFFTENGFPLYEGYGLTETGMVSIKSPLDKFETVGKLIPGIEVMTDEEGIIHIKNDIVRTEKYDNYTEEENRKIFPEPGHIVTGDLGEVSQDGYLFIHGRKKDIIVLSSGKKINAVELEEKILEIPHVKQCMVIGNERPYIIGLAVIDSLSQKKYVQDQVKLINVGLAEHERIKDMVFVDKEFTAENNLMTRSGKIIRTEIEKYYEEEILLCY